MGWFCDLKTCGYLLGLTFCSCIVTQKLKKLGWIHAEDAMEAHRATHMIAAAKKEKKKMLRTSKLMVSDAG